MLKYPKFLIFVLTLFFFSSAPQAQTESKFISLNEFIASRSNLGDPSNLYVIELRCTILNRIMGVLAKKNNMNKEASYFDITAQRFLKSSINSLQEAKLPEVRMRDDIKYYDDLYTEILSRNYTRTGNYFDEPVFKSDSAVCKGLEKGLE